MKSKGFLLKEVFLLPLRASLPLSGSAGIQCRQSAGLCCSYVEEALSMHCIKRVGVSFLPVLPPAKNVAGRCLAGCFSPVVFSG